MDQIEIMYEKNLLKCYLFQMPLITCDIEISYVYKLFIIKSIKFMYVKFFELKSNEVLLLYSNNINH